MEEVLAGSASDLEAIRVRTGEFGAAGRHDSIRSAAGFDIELSLPESIAISLCDRHIDIALGLAGVGVDAAEAVAELADGQLVAPVGQL